MNKGAREIQKISGVANDYIKVFCKNQVPLGTLK